MSTFDDRAFRRIISEILRDLADKVERREVEATEFATLPLAECPPGYAVHRITFKVRKS